MTAPPVRRSPTHTAEVTATAAVTARMRRVSLRGPSLRGVVVRPAQDVELWLRAEGGRRVKRRYTIRHARPEQGELDLDVLVHGHGPGSAWGAGARPGDQVQFQGPRGKLQLTPAAWHLLAGDESALPAIASVCEALPPAEPALAVIEVDSAADRVPLRPGVTVRWVHRDGAPPGGAQLLSAALAAVPLPDGPGHGYLMGETRAVVALRAVLERRGVAHDAVFVKGYWNLGRPDRLAGRPPGPA